jgi:hypothetical protein
VLSTAREPVPGALIIALQREDVVLPGDLALRKAVRAAYRLDHLPTQQGVLAIAEKWRPYRSLATSYLFSDGFDPAGLPDLHASVDHEVDARHVGALVGREEQRPLPIRCQLAPSDTELVYLRVVAPAVWPVSGRSDSAGTGSRSCYIT